MTFNQATAIVTDCIHSVTGSQDTIDLSASLKAAGIQTSTALDALNDSICTDVNIGVPSVGEHLEENALDLTTDTVVNSVIGQVHDKSTKMHPALLQAFVNALSAEPDKKAIARLSMNTSDLRRQLPLPAKKTKRS
ncbi:MAG TPA: hypothetical protein VKW06_19225 [Candidatus Angelobacter sp.]|nr:hypothetical protein [Candidatus Angelobacter sp.]